MTTLEFEVNKARLAREILNADSVEMLDAVQKAIHRFAKRASAKSAEITATESLAPYTMEELNARIDEFEAELDAGKPGYTTEQLDARMKQKYPFLCK